MSQSSTGAAECAPRWKLTRPRTALSDHKFHRLRILELTHKIPGRGIPQFRSFERLPARRDVRQRIHPRIQSPVRSVPLCRTIKCELPNDAAWLGAL